MQNSIRCVSENELKNTMNLFVVSVLLVLYVRFEAFSVDSFVSKKN